MCALLGVLLSMMLVEWHWPAGLWRWPRSLALGGGLGAAARRADHAPAAAAVHRHALRPAALSRRGALHRARFHQGLRQRGGLRVASNVRVRERRRRTDAVRDCCASWPWPAWVLLHRSVYGRHLFAVGRNEEAARYAGVSEHSAVIAWAYVLSGIAGRGVGHHHRVLHEFDLARRRTAISTSSTRSPQPWSAAAACAAAKARSSASSWARRCCRCLRNLVNLLDIPRLARFRGDGRRDPDRRDGRSDRCAAVRPHRAIELRRRPQHFA